MVLQGGPCGRVGHRRTTINKEATLSGGLFAFPGSLPRKPIPLIAQKAATSLVVVAVVNHLRCLYLKTDVGFMGTIVAVKTKLALADAVGIERLGSDLIVLVPGSDEALVLSGEAAELVAGIASGRSIVAWSPLVEGLVARGVLSAPGLSRRNLFRAGALGAGAGIAVLAMPGVAAAASSEATESGSGSLRDGGVGIDSGNFLKIRIYVKDDSQPSGLPNLTAGETGTLTITLDPPLAPFTVTWVSAGANSGFENTTDVYAGRSEAAAVIARAPRSLEFVLDGETVTVTN